MFLVAIVEVLKVTILTFKTVNLFQYLTEHELGVDEHELRVDEHELGVDEHELGVDVHELGVDEHELGVKDDAII